ncbi:MAG TPA: hypothetical protein VHT91_26695 [Kofleriaceae bacterium]|nr:hypothetical protein [Kofleriaceae bacterium]
MRRVASVGWLLLVGCNRIFGITATQPYDAMPDVIADMPHVVLTRQLATTLPSGAPSATLDYPPFEPGAAPQIRIATLDGPFTAVSYSSEAATPGWILVPRSYFESGDASTVAPWRLEYTLPGGVPHEVQWAPDDKLGHLVVPMAGRLVRSPVLVGSGYHVTMTNHNTFTTTDNVRVLTTGVWTTGRTNPPGGAVVDYDFPGATFLSGDRGSLDAAQGDRGFVVQYAIDPDNKMIPCNVAVGSAALTQLALTQGAHTMQTATWDAGRVKVNSELPDANAFSRLATALDALNTGVSSLDSWLLFGSVPSTSFPGLIGSASPFQLPIPVMQTLLQCPQGPLSQGPMTPSAIPATAQPTLLGDYPTVVHVQLVDPRPVPALGVTLYSGMETVIAASAGVGFRMSFPAAIPTGMTLDTPAARGVDLVHSADQVAVGLPTGPFTLAFTPETGVGLRADYHDVYLHRIVSGALTTERIYTVTALQVRIDASVLAPDADYVFEIRSYAGHVMAPRGDFAPVDYPYGSAVVFTRTFKTSTPP